MTPAPAPAPAQIDAVSHRLGGGCDRGQGLLFYARDWLDTACGEGIALIVALAAGVWAALSLAADFVRCGRGRAWAPRYPKRISTSLARCSSPAAIRGGSPVGPSARRPTHPF